MVRELESSLAAANGKVSLLEKDLAFLNSKMSDYECTKKEASKLREETISLQKTVDEAKKKERESKQREDFEREKSNKRILEVSRIVFQELFFFNVVVIIFCHASLLCSGFFAISGLAGSIYHLL